MFEQEKMQIFLPEEGSWSAIKIDWQGNIVAKCSGTFIKGDRDYEDDDDAKFWGGQKPLVSTVLVSLELYLFALWEKKQKKLVYE